MRKHLYILLVLVAIVSAYMVACKNKPTAMAEFIEEPESPTDDNTIKPMDTLPNTNQLIGYDKKYFASKKYYSTSDNTRVEFRYSIEIKQSTAANGGTLAEFKGYEKGAEFTRTYTGTWRLANNKFSLIKATGGGDGADRAEIEFNTQGWAYFKPADYNFTITLALTNKSTS